MIRGDEHAQKIISCGAHAQIISHRKLRKLRSLLLVKDSNQLPAAHATLLQDNKVGAKPWYNPSAFNSYADPAGWRNIEMIPRGCLKYEHQLNLRAKRLVETTALELYSSSERISKRLGWETH